MPRARGFRDPRSVVLNRQVIQELTNLLHGNRQHITISRRSPEFLEQALHRINGAHDRHLNLRSARSNNLLKSPNDGYTIAVKDNFVTKDLPTTCASDILRGFAAQDATVVQLLQEAGMEIVAKTNMDEFAMGSHSTHSAFGHVVNNVEKMQLSAGGSSGGSALAVATRLADTAIGSDTGGSVRLPAAYTQTVGFKPSYGRISRHGLIPYANSLDTVGLFGRRVSDVFLLYGILAKYDRKDPTSLTPETRVRISKARLARRGKEGPFFPDLMRPAPDRYQELRGVHRTTRLKIFGEEDKKLKRRRRVGVPVEYNISELHPEVRKAWTRTLSVLQLAGHDIVPISLPSTQQALSAYYVLAPAEASSNLAKYDGVRYGNPRNSVFADDSDGTLYAGYRGSFFGDEVKRRILLGSFTLSAGSMDNYFIQAQKVRRIVQSDFDAVFRMANPLLPDTEINPEGVDYIVCPTAPTPPPTIAELQEADHLDSYINDVFTVPASLAGLPAISVPAYSDSSFRPGYEASIGMQVIGQFGDDYGTLGFASLIERQPEPVAQTRVFDRQFKLK